MAKIIFEFDIYEDADLIETHNNALKNEIAIDKIIAIKRQIEKSDFNYCADTLDLVFKKIYEALED